MYWIQCPVSFWSNLFCICIPINLYIYKKKKKIRYFLGKTGWYIPKLLFNYKISQISMSLKKSCSKISYNWKSKSTIKNFLRYQRPNARGDWIQITAMEDIEQDKEILGIYLFLWIKCTITLIYAFWVHDLLLHNIQLLRFTKN